MLNETLWIVVADHTQMRVFSKEAYATLKPVFEHHLSLHPAKEIAFYLEGAFQEGKFDKFVLITPHKMLHEIETHLQHELKDVLFGKEAKELNHLNTQELQDYLQEQTAWFKTRIPAA